MADSFHVLVIGGGITGIGIARDLALRGIDATVIEKGAVASGTTGRMHGLLHSGARYAVNDSVSAQQCIAENQILRRIAGECVTATGGLFVQQPGTSDRYFDEKLADCRRCGIPTDVLSGDEARATEPSLAADISRAIQVPDASVDPFKLCAANALDAVQHGAVIETGAEVTDLLVEDDQVTGVEIHRSTDPANRSTPKSGSTETLHADYVVNAAGPWAGQITTLAGLSLDMQYSKGTMVVTNFSDVSTVINRCRPATDADILVPVSGTSILGTTAVNVENPDECSVEEWEVALLVTELSRVVPALAASKITRSYWGIRPLVDSGCNDSENTRTNTRDFHLIDHGDRDGVSGLLTIVGGKLTTYRLMAERVGNHICDRFGFTPVCRTADSELPGTQDSSEISQFVTELGLNTSLGRGEVYT